MDREALKAQLRRDEGCRLRPYRDTQDVLTIGYGRNLSRVGITRDEAEDLLEHDVLKVEGALTARWPPFLHLDDVRQQVIANMAYNLGVDGLLSFKHMLAACAQGDYLRAAAHMRQSRWAAQVGERAQRLARAMESGEP